MNVIKKKKILIVSNTKVAPEKATKPLTSWRYNFFRFCTLYQNLNVLWIGIKCSFPLALWRWVCSKGSQDAFQEHARHSMSRGSPTLISQQAVCDIVSPQSECKAKESLLTKVHTEKNWCAAYEVVCVSSAWRKKGRKEKGALLFGIKIQLGLVWF